MSALCFECGRRLEQAVDDRLRPCGAARHVDVDGQGDVYAAQDVVSVMEDAARSGAEADRNYDLRGGHLVVETAQHTGVIRVDCACDQEDVRVLRVAYVQDADRSGSYLGPRAANKLQYASVAVSSSRCSEISRGTGGGRASLPSHDERQDGQVTRPPP